MSPLRIISGGQTGVDRAALDAAQAAGLCIGGWCPLGRLAEDGSIPHSYPLKETNSPDYSIRTEWNVRDSDGTLILYNFELEGGTLFTLQLAQLFNKPHQLVRLDRFDSTDFDVILRWLAENRIGILNVAGPRESTRPGTYEHAFSFLTRLFDSAG